MTPFHIPPDPVYSVIRVRPHVQFTAKDLLGEDAAVSITGISLDFDKEHRFDHGEIRLLVNGKFRGLFDVRHILNVQEEVVRGYAEGFEKPHPPRSGITLDVPVLLERSDVLTVVAGRDVLLHVMSISP